MTRRKAEIVICGAGIAGVSAAYHLAVRRGVQNITLVDAGAPLSLTSDKSMECYRNWYPGPGSQMVELMNRSIDIMEALELETDHRFHMNRRGYAFATARPAEADRLHEEAIEEQRLGVGPLRVHDGASHAGDYRPSAPSGFDPELRGSDLLLDQTLIRAHFPHLAPDVVAVLHARRCGWLSAHQYGTYLLEQARERGVSFLKGEVVSVSTAAGRVDGVVVETGSESVRIDTGCFLSAAGPLQRTIGNRLGLDLPLSCELHLKSSFADSHGVIPRQSPMLIWMDPGPLCWQEDEKEVLRESTETRHLLGDFPAGVHGRPEGAGNHIILQWTHDIAEVEPTFPIVIDPHYEQMLLRAMAVAMPAMSTYFGHAPKPYVDGGYYCKTPENRPLAAPLPVPGAYIIGGLSGFGMQSASALGELVSLHITGDTLPGYAPSFQLDRYQDPVYLEAVASVDPRLGQI